jgi:hypothetical protein
MGGDVARLPEHGGMPGNPFDDIRVVWEQQLRATATPGYSLPGRNHFRLLSKSINLAIFTPILLDNTDSH